MKRESQTDQEARDKRFAQLWDQGLTLDVIAERTGLTKSALVKARARLGLTPRRAGTGGQA